MSNIHKHYMLLSNSMNEFTWIENTYSLIQQDHIKILLQTQASGFILWGTALRNSLEKESPLSVRWYCKYYCRLIHLKPCAKGDVKFAGTDNEVS